MPERSGYPVGNDQHLYLSSILHESTWFPHFRDLTLEYVESPETLLVGVFTRCSCSLVSVALLYVRIASSGSWSDVLRKARNSDFKVLYQFLLFDCGEARGVVPAQDYLKRTTDKDPIAERIENGNDDSD